MAKSDKPERKVWRKDTTAPHPLFSGMLTERYLIDRAWRADIPKAGQDDPPAALTQKTS